MKLIDILQESNNDVDAKYNELLNDKRYMDELISDMLSAEGKKNTPDNRKAAYRRATTTGYLRDVAKQQLDK